jgi:hypothetical protein
MLCFEQGETVLGYYKRIEPPDAVILRKLPPFDSHVVGPAMPHAFTTMTPVGH